MRYVKAEIKVRKSMTGQELFSIKKKKVQISLNKGGFTICLETVKKLKSSKAEVTVFTQQICILPKPIFIV